MTTETHITQHHKNALLQFNTAQQVALVSCFHNGKPAVALARIDETSDKKHFLHITPLFVCIEPGDVLADHEGVVTKSPSSDPEPQYPSVTED